MALSEKIKEIIGALTDSLNPMGESEYEDEGWGFLYFASIPVFFLI